MAEASFLALHSVPMVEPGHDLAAVLVDVLAANSVELEAGDILVVAQKIVSKAEGRLVPLAEECRSVKCDALLAISIRGPVDERSAAGDRRSAAGDPTPPLAYDGRSDTGLHRTVRQSRANVLLS